MLRTPRLKARNVRRKPVWMVEDRDGQKGGRFKFPRTAEGKLAAQKKIDELVREQLLADDQPLLNPMVDRDAILGTVVEREDKTFELGGYGGAWLAQRGGRLRTRKSRADLFRKHLVPFDLGGGRTLGSLRVRDISRAHVRLFIVEKRERGYRKDDGTLLPLAPDTVRLMYRLLDAILATATADGILLRHPIDRELKRELRPHFKRDRGDVKAFTQEQARTFLATAKESSALYPLYVTGFLAGLRIGELCGLQLDDDRWTVRDGKRVRLLHIERQLGQECSMLDPEPGPPKNGIRDVEVGRDLGLVLDQLKAKRPKLAVANGWRPVPTWAFITGNGTPYSQRFVLRDFHRVLKKARLADLTPHSMRHSFACFHIAKRKSAKWVQQQMGHSSIQVTLDVYADAFNLTDQDAADELGAALLAT